MKSEAREESNGEGEELRGFFSDFSSPEMISLHLLDLIPSLPCLYYDYWFWFGISARISRYLLSRWCFDCRFALSGYSIPFGASPNDVAIFSQVFIYLRTYKPGGCMRRNATVSFSKPASFLLRFPAYEKKRIHRKPAKTGFFIWKGKSLQSFFNTSVSVCESQNVMKQRLSLGPILLSRRIKFPF